MPPLTLTPGTRLGPYEILAPLGAGGMGEVYRARDVRLGRDVAIKVLPTSIADDAERLARFEREARTASSLNHPNILTIFEIGDAAGIRFIASELVGGQTLRARLARSALAIADALDVAIQMAAASRSPNNAFAVGELFRIYLASGQKRTARLYMERHSALDPLTPIVHVQRFYTELFFGRPEDLFESTDRLLTAVPAAGMLRFVYAVALVRGGRTDAARALLFARLKRRSPRSLVRRAGASNMLWPAGDPKRSR